MLRIAGKQNKYYHSSFFSISFLSFISTRESSLNRCLRASVSIWNSELLSSTLRSSSEMGLLI